MITILAHGAATNGLPLPRWLLAYLLAFLALLTVLTLRATSPRSRWGERPSAPPDGPRPLELATSAIGLLLFAGTFVAAVFSLDDAGLFSYTALVVVFWLGGQVLALLVGDWYRWLDPFVVLTAALPDREREAPSWTAPVMLASLLWFWLVFGERAPTNREVGVYLGIYLIAVLVGALVWGRRWVREGEGFAATFALIGSLALLRRRAPTRGLAERATRPGTLALVAVLLGGVSFDGLSQTGWWVDVMGTRSGWPLRIVNTVGLAWTTTIVAVIVLAAARAIGAMTDAPTTLLTDKLAKSVVPIAVACWIAHELPTLMIDGQNFYGLISDPLARGWDLFDTIDVLPNYTLLTANEQGWIGTIALTGSAIAASVVAHEVVFASFKPRVAVRVVWPIAIALMTILVGAGLLLLGT